MALACCRRLSVVANGDATLWWVVSSALQELSAQDVVLSRGDVIPIYEMDFCFPSTHHYSATPPHFALPVNTGSQWFTGTQLKISDYTICEVGARSIN